MPFVKIEDSVSKELFAGFHGKFIHSDNMTFAWWDIEAGSELPPHSHPHEQVANVLEGTFEMTIDGQTHLLEPGTMAVIPSNAVHSGKAITACRILDVFQPVREEYR